MFGSCIRLSRLSCDVCGCCYCRIGCCHSLVVVSLFLGFQDGDFVDRYIVMAIVLMWMGGMSMSAKVPSFLLFLLISLRDSFVVRP